MTRLTATRHGFGRLISCMLALCAGLFVTCASPAVASERVINVPLADNASIAYLLTQKDGSEPGWILFAGGDGDLQLTQASDGCFLCSFNAVKSIANDGHDLIAVSGGSARGNPCEAIGHHGFYGQDEAVVAALKAWISGAEWPKEVH